MVSQALREILDSNDNREHEDLSSDDKCKSKEDKIKNIIVLVG